MRKILFLCTGNSCRSQIAEAFCKHYHWNSIEAYSAGIKASGLNLYALKVMLEEGIDISGQKSKTIEELPEKNFDYVFTLCDNARDACPYFPGKAKIIHVGFEEPPEITKNFREEEKVLEVYRRVRNEIKEFVVNIKTYLK